jgi:hypothetical protein
VEPSWSQRRAARSGRAELSHSQTARPEDVVVQLVTARLTIHSVRRHERGQPFVVWSLRRSSLSSLHRGHEILTPRRC